MMPHTWSCGDAAMWTKKDRRFLRSLRIVADEPAPATARFVVRKGLNDNEYVVIDLQGSFRPCVIGRGLKNPRAAAEDVARQMNENFKAKTE